MVFISYKISIIVPIFNVERYLRRALDSILSQSFSMNELQVILVDDASTDGSREIAEEYIERYDNFEGVFLKENSGSAAEPRNRGLEMAEGEYIMFLDPDDELKPNFCRVLYGKITETGADLVKCNYVSVYPDHKEYNYYFDKKINEAIVKSSQQPLRYVTIWNGIHRASLLRDNNIRFHDCIGEDFVFTLEEFLAMDSMVYLNNFFGYSYYHNETGSHATAPSADKFYRTLASFYLALDIAEKNNRRDVIPDLFGQQIIGLYSRIVNLDAPKNEKMKMIGEIAKLSEKLNCRLNLTSPIYSRAHSLVSKGRISAAYYYLKAFEKVRGIR